MNAYVGSEIQFSGRQKGFNTNKAGAEVSITVPKFIIPFFLLGLTLPAAQADVIYIYGKRRVISQAEWEQFTQSIEFNQQVSWYNNMLSFFGFSVSLIMTDIRCAANRSVSTYTSHVMTTALEAGLAAVKGVVGPMYSANKLKAGERVTITWADGGTTEFTATGPSTLYGVSEIPGTYTHTPGDGVAKEGAICNPT